MKLKATPSAPSTTRPVSEASVAAFLLISSLVSSGCDRVLGKAASDNVTVAASAPTTDPWAERFSQDTRLCSYQELMNGAPNAEVLRRDQLMYPGRDGDTRKLREWWDLDGDGAPDCRTSIDFSRTESSMTIGPLTNLPVIGSTYEETWEGGPKISTSVIEDVGFGLVMKTDLIDDNQDGQTFGVKMTVNGQLLAESPTNDLTYEEIETLIGMLRAGLMEDLIGELHEQTPPSRGEGYGFSNPDLIPL